MAIYKDQQGQWEELDHAEYRKVCNTRLVSSLHEHPAVPPEAMNGINNDTIAINGLGDQLSHPAAYFVSWKVEMEGTVIKVIPKPEGAVFLSMDTSRLRDGCVFPGLYSGREVASKTSSVNFEPVYKSIFFKVTTFYGLKRLYRMGGS